MILNTDNTKALLNSEGMYSGLLTTKKWSYYFFENEISPLGDIVAFEAPIKLGTMTLTKGLVLAIELPSCNSFGSTCFNRLYCAQLGSLMSEALNEECYVDGNCHFVEGKQCSLSLNSIVSETALINIVISLCPENQAILHPVNLAEDFKQKAIESFYYLTKSIFIETRRDNL